MHDEEFAQFAAEVEPRLRRAFVAAYGPERGREATQEALVYAFQHWDRVRRMENSAGYLYRVGQSRSRPRRRAARVVHEWWSPAADASLIEPRLVTFLNGLPEQQRVAVVLVHGFEWTQREVADLLGVAPSTVQTHVERGLTKLRDALEAQRDG